MYNVNLVSDAESASLEDFLSFVWRCVLLEIVLYLSRSPASLSIPTSMDPFSKLGDLLDITFKCFSEISEILESFFSYMSSDFRDLLAILLQFLRAQPSLFKSNACNIFHELLRVEDGVPRSWFYVPGLHGQP